MITEDYVSFEVAKLLKEKGFDEKCRSYYFGSSGRHSRCALEIKTNDFRDGEILRPTLQMACKWLREIYDLHIIAYPYKANDKKKWCCYVYKTFNLLGCEQYIDETLDSYEEAVEAALKYVLENLV